MRKDGCVYTVKGDAAFHKYPSRAGSENATFYLQRKETIHDNPCLLLQTPVCVHDGSFQTGAAGGRCLLSSLLSRPPTAVPPSRSYLS
ncbi:hypothetical protein TGRH88_031820 [Toxoplasma gondii]|uniref:Uncharacterized protein n=1 Tax=Toxoplasma gondii TaxID=5811 RepID=A0A7J6KAG6_TOXGO|nr:hypothetical protein TGRH88_031820 [Toxoplasma gondii]